MSARSRGGRPAGAAQRLHAGLVGARGLVGSRYMADPDLREAYDADIAPRTEAALARVFDHAALGPLRRVLDLGAGSGAVARFLRARLDRMPALVAVDRVAGPGVLGADLRQPGRPRGVDGRFDLIVAAHLLNELDLGPPARARLVEIWADELLEPGGAIVLLEPALRETSRALSMVRDQLVRAGLHVVAPCFWRGDCPALARERDWCHDAAPWGDDRRGRDPRRRVDFSYLVLRAGPAADADPGLVRVVSDPLVEKGKRKLHVCGGVHGRQLLVRLDRERRPDNLGFDEAVRGDVLRIEGATEERPDERRVMAATQVRKT